jgi:hypothetical protein
LTIIWGLSIQNLIQSIDWLLLANVGYVALVTVNPISKAAKEQFFISEI